MPRLARIFGWALVAWTIGFGRSAFSADSSEGAARPSIDRFKLDDAGAP
jgi:RES domain-containing protein